MSVRPGDVYFDDDPPFEPKSDTHERIAIDLHALVAEVLTAPAPKDMPKEHEQSWRFHWLMAAIWGYVQTDLGVPHQSGEDASGWREDGRRVGLDFSGVRGLTYAERARDEKQRQLFAEAMAPKVVEQATACFSPAFLDSLRDELREDDKP